ncbi:hypothetical protein E2553_33385 [Paraburkholderia dipogonis]|uniref:Uncharacterized protein n=1 Tax=Paraburkholderia dipogonis TaxID=1211383 RepID=A0A4Y8MW14_9BURK|nr:hypothetical protein [Paraburkholderia dipogonis]TFE41555.1 hypothetical protein E2553_33385 [Paraburkholderia dipogonis]
MDLLEIARQSGMTVVLDARIGQIEYQSVYGSVNSLKKLIETIVALVSDDVTDAIHVSGETGFCDDATADCTTNRRLQ